MIKRVVRWWAPWLFVGMAWGQAATDAGGAALAEDRVYEPRAEGPVDGGRGDTSVALVVTYLVLLTAGAGAIMYLVRRGRPVAGRTAGAGGSISVVSTRPLGQRHYLLLVEVEGQRLLLAAGPQGVQMLQALGPAASYAAVAARVGEPDGGVR